MSQGGTKTVFMIPQIVNPGSNFLLLVHSTNEVNTGFISHFPRVIDKVDKEQDSKINSKHRASVSNATLKVQISFQRSSVAQLRAGAFLPANKQPTQGLRERKNISLMRVFCEENNTTPYGFLIACSL